jgi:signal peptidase II
MNRCRLARSLVLAALVVSLIGCDQAVKHVARVHLADSPPLVYLGGSVRLTLAHNEGGFLSLGSSLSPRVRRVVFSLGVAAVLLLGAVYLSRATSLAPLALACGWLAWAGGISNLVDRLLFDGRVTDFVVLGLGPLRTGVFNLADVAIMAGAVLLALTAARESHGRDAEETEGE